jgi:hypothetical protein
MVVSAEIEKLAELIKRGDVRSADRANMKGMLAKLRHGIPLSYQERQNLWAYFNRYNVQIVASDR